MFSRRHFCCSGAIAASLLTVDRAFAADQCAALTPERQSALSPDDALVKLKAGNERFVSRNMRNCDLIEQVRATAGGQFPSSVIIGCIDSRVPPELVFDQRIGDVFSARVAGNIVNDDIVGSSEFATKLAGAKLIVGLAIASAAPSKARSTVPSSANLRSSSQRSGPPSKQIGTRPVITPRKTRISFKRWQRPTPSLPPRT